MATMNCAPQTIVEQVIEVNNQRKKRMASKVIDFCGGSVSGLTVCVLGLTFKPNTDDMRDAPSLMIIPALQDNGAIIRAYDPEGMAQAKSVLENVEFAQSAYAAIEGADALVLVTEWDAFRALDLKRVKSLLKTPIVVDLRNVYAPDEMKKLGFAYTSIGR